MYLIRVISGSKSAVLGPGSEGVLGSSSARVIGSGIAMVAASEVSPWLIFYVSVMSRMVMAAEEGNMNVIQSIMAIGNSNI